jgi:hypothetical protein
MPHKNDFTEGQNTIEYILMVHLTLFGFFLNTKVRLGPAVSPKSPESHRHGGKVLTSVKLETG